MPEAATPSPTPSRPERRPPGVRKASGRWLVAGMALAAGGFLVLCLGLVGTRERYGFARAHRPAVVVAVLGGLTFVTGALLISRHLRERVAAKPPGGGRKPLVRFEAPSRRRVQVRVLLWVVLGTALALLVRFCGTFDLTIPA